MAIQTVYAYRDDGAMSALSKWKPRRVECSRKPDHSDLPGELFVVKYASEPDCCACAISELVCTQLLARIGVRTLKPYLVSVSENFAASCNLKSDFPRRIFPGLHYGTLLRLDVENGPPAHLDQLADPAALVLLWVGDTWIGNIDRAIEGNTLLNPAGKGKYHMIASDQSDCFGGTSEFCGKGFPERFLRQGRAPSIRFLQDAVAKTGGPNILNSAIECVLDAAKDLEAIAGTVPQLWWDSSLIQPKTMIKALILRAQALADVIKPREWEVPDGFLNL
jgi:hypothetical protein